MAILRTKRLARGRVNPSGMASELPTEKVISEIVYTCPPSTRAIVRDIRLVSSAAVAGGWTYIYVYGSGAPTIVWVGVITDLPLGGTGTACDVALEPGDNLAIDSSLDQLDWYITGAELPIPPV